MILLPLLATLSTPITLILLILSLASALYQLSLLVEEHSSLTRTLLTRLIYLLLALLPLLCLLDGFPLPLIILALASHATYLQTMRDWPVVRIQGPWFIGSCVAVLVNHIAFTRWFASVRSADLRRSAAASDPWGEYRFAPFGGWLGGGGGENGAEPSLTEVSTFFAVFVWLVPMALFVSLSAGDNVLPSINEARSGTSTPLPGMGFSFGGGQQQSGVGVNLSADDGRSWRGHARADSLTGTRRRQGLVRQMFERGWEWAGETGEVVGLWGGGRTRPVRAKRSV